MPLYNNYIIFIAIAIVFVMALTLLNLFFQLEACRSKLYLMYNVSTDQEIPEPSAEWKDVCKRCILPKVYIYIYVTYSTGVVYACMHVQIMHKINVVLIVGYGPLHVHQYIQPVMLQERNLGTCLFSDGQL